MTTVAENPHKQSQIAFAPAGARDFDRLVDLKIAVQGDHLRRLGRFTPERARSRFAEGFSPERTQLILVDGDFAGCVTLHVRADHTEIEHLYVASAFQGRRVGSAMMARLMAESRSLGLPMRATVLNDSPANAFYRRLGFREVDRDPIDVRYVWEE